MHHNAELRLRLALPEALEVLRLVIRETPGARALDEELNDVGVHVDRVVQRLLDPTRAVRAEQHGSTLTARPFAGHGA